jgi:hypothetical protein
LKNGAFADFIKAVGFDPRLRDLAFLEIFSKTLCDFGFETTYACLSRAACLF